MAQGPGGLIKEFENEVSMFEMEIDAELKSKKLYEGEAIDINYPSGMSNKHLEILRVKYIDAGWKNVTIRQCGMNESCLSFQSYA